MDLLSQREGEADFSDDDDLDLDSFDPFSLDVPEASADAPEESEEDEKINAALSLDAGWDDERQEVVAQIVKANILPLFRQNSSPERMKGCVNWLYVPGIKDQNGRDYATCCTALGVRQLMVRAYAMYAMWNAGTSPGPLSPAAVDMPETLQSEIKLRTRSIDAISLAETMWSWPGISIRDAWEISGVDPADGKKWLSFLEAEGYVAAKLGRWYFVSRNPGIMDVAARRRFSYALSIVGDD